MRRAHTKTGYRSRTVTRSPHIMCGNLGSEHPIVLPVYLRAELTVFAVCSGYVGLCCVPRLPSLVYVVDHATIPCLQAPRVRLRAVNTHADDDRIAGDCDRPPTAGSIGQGASYPPYWIPPVVLKMRVLRRRAFCLHPLCTCGGYVHSSLLRLLCVPSQVELNYACHNLTARVVGSVRLCNSPCLHPIALW